MRTVGHRAFWLQFAVTSAVMGVLFGSIGYASSRSAPEGPWVLYAAGAILYTAVVSAPTSFGLFLLMPRLHRLRRSRQLPAALVLFVPLTFASWLVAELFGRAIHSRSALAEIIGTTLVAFLITFLQDMQARLRAEELAAERSLRLASAAQLASLE